MFKPGRHPPERWSVETWNIAFLGYPARHSWDRFSPPDCRHVLAWGYAARADAWVYVNPAWRGAGVLLAAGDELGELLEADGIDYATAVLARPRGERRRLQPRPLTTCATIIADLVGFPSGALRPIALYRDLVSDRETEVIHGLQPTRHARKPQARPRSGGGSLAPGRSPART